jgi:pimeloyl-ACP methyl ester carboxylesterase
LFLKIIAYIQLYFTSFSKNNTMIDLIIIILLVGLIYLAMAANVRKLEAKPHKFPREVISKNPKGKETFLTLADGAKVKTISAGEGQTIVFAHGYAASLIEWNVIADQLVNEGFRIIAFDQVGHGGSTIGSHGISSSSMAAAYEAVLEHYDVKDGVLVGHSMGGFLSIVFLLAHPELVSKRLKSAMIMAGFAGDILRDNAQNKLQIPMIESGLMTKIAKTKLLGYPFGASVMGDDPDTVMIDLFLRDFQNTNHQRLIPILKAFNDESYYGRLNEIQIPCSIVVGTKDKTTPPFHTDDMAANIPNSKLIRIEGKGHILNWEASDEILAEIRVLAAR